MNWKTGITFYLKLTCRKVEGVDTILRWSWKGKGKYRVEAELNTEILVMNNDQCCYPYRTGGVGDRRSNSNRSRGGGAM